jgi:RHS repeat-associated protein
MKPAFYHFDALGSTVAMSDSANRITARFVYDPYGARRSTPETQEKYGFVGRLGVAQGLGNMQHMGMREYDLGSGSFMSLDPIRGAGEMTLSCRQPGSRGFVLLELYAYAGGNPVINTDSEGLVCGSWWNDGIVADFIPGVYNFSSACSIHDRCYGTLGKTKEACDNAFLANMLSGCSNDVCRWAAELYHGAVIAYGDQAYKDGQREASCPSKAIPSREDYYRSVSTSAP